MPAPALDGFITKTATGTSTATFALTTTLANDLIVVASFCEQSGGAPSVTAVTSSGLTFTTKYGSVSSASGLGSLAFWTAKAAGILSAASITVTYSGNFDDCSIVAFGVSGAAATLPFDPNFNLPLKQSNTSGAWAPSFTLTTGNANDFILVAYGAAAASNPTLPAGYTSIANANNGGGAKWSYLAVGYKQVTAIQSGVAVTAGSYNTGGGGEAVLDVITADAGGTAGATPPPQIQVSKLNAYAVLGPMTGVDITKLNAYAVLGFTMAPVWLPFTFTGGVVGNAYNQSFSLDGSQPIAISVSGGALPPGLALSAYGTSGATVSGTPTLAGTYNFTLNAVNAYGSAAQSLSIVVGTGGIGPRNSGWIY